MERLERRREQLGPVNPLAQDEYAEAVAHVEEMEGRRADLETALRELRALISDTDRQIQETFEETFQAAARNFEELVGDVFPGGSGRLRLVSEEQAPRGRAGRPAPVRGALEQRWRRAANGAGDAAPRPSRRPPRPRRGGLRGREQEELLGVEIEITPAGKSAKRLSLLSGGEKSMTALAFLFAVFLARPCPFYVLDEVEAALDDLNLDRFLALLRRYSDRAQFIVITHQKRTMEAADWLYRRVDGRRRRLEGPLAAPARRARGGVRGRRGRLSASAAIVARPVARDWSDLFITAEPAGGAGVRRGRRARASRGWPPPQRLLPPPAREHGQDPPGARLRDPGDAVRGARRADVGTPGGGADHGRRRREHDRIGGAGSSRPKPRGKDRGRRGPEGAADRAARRDGDGRRGRIDIRAEPTVILMVGVNGTGKTTTIGKLAWHLHNELGRSVLLAAADTFRAAASEQLEGWAQTGGRRSS